MSIRVGGFSGGLVGFIRVVIVVGGGMFLPAFTSFGGCGTVVSVRSVVCCSLTPNWAGRGFWAPGRGPLLDSQTSVAGCVHISEL